MPLPRGESGSIGILQASGPASAPSTRSILPASTPTLLPSLTESAPCLACKKADFDPILDGVRDRVWWKPGSFSVARCRSCGLVQTWPRPTAATLDAAYAGTYDSPESRDGLQTFYEGRVGRLLNHYRLITIEKVRPVVDTDHIVDVGCSYGHFLQYARQARGARTTGLDTDQGSLDHAVDPTHCTYRLEPLTHDTLPSESATIITFLECLEHDPHPITTLRSARRVLVPGGLVSIELPMWDSGWRPVFGRFWHPLFAPQHLTHFSRRTLEDTVRAAGLEPVHHQTMLFPSELTLSLRAALFEALFGPGWRPRATTERLFAPLWVLVFWLLDVPSQFFLRLIGRAGHQTLIARRPTE